LFFPKQTKKTADETVGKDTGSLAQEDATSGSPHNAGTAADETIGKDSGSAADEDAPSGTPSNTEHLL
jgi:D-alanyl-D-alanine dipeptidase